MSTVALVILFAMAVVAASWWITGKLGAQPLETAEVDSAPQLTVTSGGVDVSTLSLPVAIRGYRMADVDAVIEQLSAVIKAQQELLQARDRGEGTHQFDSSPATAPAAGAPPISDVER